MKEEEGKAAEVRCTSYDELLLIYLGYQDLFNWSYASTNPKEIRER